VPVAEPADGHIQFFMTLVILILGSWLHLMIQPYSDRYANILEALELAFLIMILTFGSWFIDQDLRAASGLTGEEENSKASLFSAILLANVAVSFFVLGCAFIFAVFLANAPEKARAMHDKEVSNVVPRLRSAAFVICQQEDAELKSFIEKATYADRDTMKKLSNLVNLELLGVVGEQVSQRRISTQRSDLDMSRKTSSEVMHEQVTAFRRTQSLAGFQGPAESNMEAEGEGDEAKNSPGEAAKEGEKGADSPAGAEDDAPPSQPPSCGIVSYIYHHHDQAQV